MNPVIGFARNLTEHPTLNHSFKYVWMEGITKAKIAFLSDVLDWRSLEEWPSGRLFGPYGEYRWKKRENDQVHAVLILDNHELPEFFTGQLELEEIDNSNLILWGDWIDPDKEQKDNPDGGPRFYAQEIPQILSYPVAGDEAAKNGNTPRLTIKRYRHKPRESEEYEGNFMRCVEIKMVPDEYSEVSNE